MMQRREDETITNFTVRLMVAEIIERELSELALIFEDNPDGEWRGNEIGDYIRDRIKNHPTLTNC